MSKNPPPSIQIYQNAADYQGSATAADHAIAQGSTAHDIWGLDKLYNNHVLLGTTTAVDTGMGFSVPGPQTDAYGTTQSFMKHVVDLWAGQTEERKKFPNRLTTYEQLQRSLWQAGFYGQTSIDGIHVGQWTTQTQDALKNALGSYEQLGEGGKLPLTFSEFLNQNAAVAQDGGQNAPSQSGGGPTRAPFASNTTDPAAIRAAVQSAAQQALGMNLSEDQIQAFVTEFQHQQVQAERASYNYQDTTTPDLSSEAMGFVQETNPHAYKQQNKTAYMDALVNLLGGVRPSQTPTPNVES
jgi:hypothetical protein